jgi:hypothetical protein
MLLMENVLIVKGVILVLMLLIAMTVLMVYSLRIMNVFQGKIVKVNKNLNKFFFFFLNRENLLNWIKKKNKE